MWPRLRIACSVLLRVVWAGYKNTLEVSNSHSSPCKAVHISARHGRDSGHFEPFWLPASLVYDLAAFVRSIQKQTGSSVIATNICLLAEISYIRVITTSISKTLSSYQCHSLKTHTLVKRLGTLTNKPCFIYLLYQRITIFSQSQ